MSEEAGSATELERRYRRLFEHVEDVYFEVTPEGLVLEVTPSCERVLGRSRHELLGSRVQWLYARSEEWDRLVEYLATRDRLEGAELELRDPRASSVHVSVSLDVVHDPAAGRIFVGTLREIERRKAAEKAAQLNEELFRKAFYTSPDAISITRADDGKIIDVNQGFTNITGWARDEVIGRTTVDLGLWVDLDARDRMVHAIKTVGHIDNLETRYQTKDGDIIWGLFSANVIELSGERHLLSVARDMTEYKRLEEQLLRAQKMEAVGRLASGIAHDFNNLLTVIRGFCRMARKGLEEDEQRAEALQEIDRAAVRAATLTRQLLAFGRRQVLLPRKLQLNELLEGMARLFGGLLSEDVELVLDLAPDLGLVRADPGQLEQVVANLVVNARDAMPEGGRLLISTGEEMLVDEDGSQRAFVVLRVRDEGVGMDEATQRRIFEPFFTTKGRDRGTGLGLSTVYGIVSQSGGRIELDSELGCGTELRVCLPRVEGMADAPEGEVPAFEGPVGGGETVLVAEDEGALRSVISHTLRQHGYEVLEAEDGRRARELATEYDGPIHALVTDLVMPGMDGGALAEAVRTRRPGLPVVLMSGYADQTMLDSVPDDADTVLLRKVFTPEELLQRLRGLLEGRSAPGS